MRDLQRGRSFRNSSLQVAYVPVVLATSPCAPADRHPFHFSLQEARFFALYSITDKSSSFFGVRTSLPASHSVTIPSCHTHDVASPSSQPFIVGLIADLTGETRYAFIFLLAMLLAPVPVLLWRVDVAGGRERARRYAKEEQGVASRTAIE